MHINFIIQFLLISHSFVFKFWLIYLLQMNGITLNIFFFEKIERFTFNEAECLFFIHPLSIQLISYLSSFSHDMKWIFMITKITFFSDRFSILNIASQQFTVPYKIALIKAQKSRWYAHTTQLYFLITFYRSIQDDTPHTPNTHDVHILDGM